jgi:S-adenosylmethionine synthetase
MSNKEYLFTSESVTEGHPDKVADQISDAVLDGCLEQDTRARVACETLVHTGMVIISGEITTSAWVDMPNVVRQVLRNIGYDDPSMGFSAKDVAVLTSIDKQSPDIAMGVDEGSAHEQGAGDQGLMFGYACNETDELMPLPIILAHKLTQRLADLRKTNRLTFLRPDGKSQVTVRYANGKPIDVETVVVSTQHSESIGYDELRDAVIEEVIKPVIPEALRHPNMRYYINPTGRFVFGGPAADCGLTGRKIIVDTYGGYARHGGGAFSGKDPSKVDRTACYMARYIAKNIVAAKLAERCEVQLAYAIGVAEPVSVMVDTFGTGRVSEETLSQAVRATFDLKPKGMIASLDMLRPIFGKTASYGHFGRELPEFVWEKRDKVQKLLELCR